MLVESYDKDGAEVYDMIIRQIFQDLQLGPSVTDMKAFVDPKEVVFIMAIKTKKTSSNTYLKEVAHTKFFKDNNQTNVFVDDENYLPHILKVLWDKYGRENVHQPDRYTIVLDGDQRFIEEYVVDNPSINLQKRVYDGIYRIVTEGFKVIKDVSRDGIIAIVATDELIRDKWVEKAEEYIDELNS